MKSKKKIIGILVAALALLASISANAQSWPAKPLKFVNGFAAGGSSDLVARFMAEKMSQGLGQQVVVEPRTGAGGVIANDYVAKSSADGYTLILITGAYPVQAAFLKTLPYDPAKDFAMLSTLTFYPFVMNVSPDSPFKTPRDFIAYAKANPGKLNFASGGIGTVHHFSAELLNVMAGLEMTHVPFRGGMMPVAELLSGRVDLLFETMTLSLPQIQAGKLRALAVTSAEPSSSLPGVPTLASAVPGFEVTSFLGVATTAGTPPEIVERLNREIRRVLNLPDIRQRFLDLGGEPHGSTPEEMARFIERETAKWKRVVDARKIEKQ